MGWEQLENGPTVTAAASPLPPIRPNVRSWTNQVALEAYRRGVAEGERRSTDNVVRAAAAAARPPAAPTPAAKPITPKPATASKPPARPSKPATPPAPSETAGVMVTMPGYEPMRMVKE